MRGIASSHNPGGLTKAMSVPETAGSSQDGSVTSEPPTQLLELMGEDARN